MRHRWWTIGVLGGLAACQTGGDEEPPPDVPRPASVETGERVVAGPTVLDDDEAWSVWWVNGAGVAVPGGAIDVVVDGVSETLPTDPSGLAQWRPPAAGVYEVEVGGTSYTVVRHDGSWSPPGLSPAIRLADDVTHTATVAGHGLLGLADGSIVEVDARGRLWSVATGLNGLQLMKAVALQPDGLRDDLLIVTEDRVLLLDRTGGRFVWSMGVEASGRVLGGAGVGQINDDDARDLVVSAGTSLDWFSLRDGSPLWVSRTELPSEAGDVGITAQPGLDVVTVLLPEGWSRLQVAGDELLDVGPEAPTAFDGLALRVSGADMDDDGVEEVVVWPRAGRTAAATVVVASLGEGGDQTVTERTWSDAGVVLADADGDGAMDLVSVEGGGTVRRLGFAGGNPREWTLGRVTPGPVALRGGGPDVLATMVVEADQVLRLFPGGANDTSPWRPADAGRTVLDVGKVVSLLSLENDDASRFGAVVEDDDGRFALRTFGWPTFPEDLVDPVGRTTLEEDETVVDLAVCGADVVLLTSDRLLRIDVSGDGHMTVAQTTEVSGTAVGCAADADGSYVGVVSAAGLTELDGVLSAVGSSDGSDLGDVSVAPPAADGDAPSFGGCLNSDCEATWIGTLDGEEAQVVASAATLEVVSLDRSRTFATLPVEIEGWTMADVDGDGDRDVLAMDPTGTAWLLRVAGGAGVSIEAAHRHALGSWAGPVATADFDGDGVVEPLGLTDDGRLALWITRE